MLSPAEKVLYVSYANGVGPYDGTNRTVHRYAHYKASSIIGFTDNQILDMTSPLGLGQISALPLQPRHHIMAMVA